MPPPKRGRAGYGGGRAGARSRGNLGSNGAVADDADQRRRTNRNVRFEGTPSNSFPSGNAAPLRPNRNQAFQLNIVRGGRSSERQTNGIKAATLDEGWRDPTNISADAYKNKMSDHRQKLKERRVKERAAAIANGLMSDPEKPTKLADAITLVGTCQDMCAEFERVERVVTNEVDDCEKISLDTSIGSPGRRVPFEKHMVKRFNRSSAGKEEELPSDVRPPLILQKTVDHLFNELIESNRAFPSVQDFIWNRTRAIRVDFSIQHISRLPDLRIAIDCLERIARFHIVSLHQRSLSIEANEHFSHQQEADQLKNTLLSLSYYYNDSRHRLQSPNEAEFRAYSIIYFLQNNETEQEAQNWPKHILWAPRVQQALKLFAAAGNTTDSHGPLVPKTPQSIAQGHFGRFWKMVGSKEISYLMACTAEIHFNRIRRAALTSIWRSRYRPKATEDWNLSDLVQVLGFDNEQQVRKYCEEHGFKTLKGGGGISYVDFTSVSDSIPGKIGISILSARLAYDFLDPSPPLKQTFSDRLVESKRYNRTLTAIINGIPASTARDVGMVEDLTAEDNSQSSKQQPESLFVQDSSDEELPSLADPKPITNGVKLETEATRPIPFANAFPPIIKRNPFTLDDGLDTGTDAEPATASDPFTNMQPSKRALQSAPLNPFANAHPSNSRFPSGNPLAPTSAVSPAPAIPPRSAFGLPSGPTVAPATSSNQSTTTSLPSPPVKTDINHENTTIPKQPPGSRFNTFQAPKSGETSNKSPITQKSNPFLPTSGSSSIFGAPALGTYPTSASPQQPPNPFLPPKSRETSNKSPITQKSNPFLPTSGSSSIFGAPASGTKPTSSTPQQPPNPFLPSADSPSIFGAASPGAKPATITPQQPSMVSQSNVNPPSMLGAAAPNTASTTTALQQSANSLSPSKMNLSSAGGIPFSSTKPITTGSEQPSSFFPTSGQSSPFAAPQPNDNTFSFLNATPATKATPLASQIPQNVSSSLFDTAKDPKANPFPTSFTLQKDAPASSPFAFPQSSKSAVNVQPNAPTLSEDRAAQPSSPAQGPFHNGATPLDKGLTAAVDLSSSSNAVNKSPAQQSTIQLPHTSTSGTTEILEQLCNSVFLEPKGLLEQLIEYTAGPIIFNAMRQVEHERLQKRTDDVIWRIRARIGIRNWKEFAYRRGLARKGRERRRRYAEDMKKLALASKRRTAEAELDEYSSSRRGNVRNSSSPKKPRVGKEVFQHHNERHSRKSLPSDIGRPGQSSEDTAARGRPDDQDANVTGGISSSPIKKATRNHHQRSRTHVDPSKLTRSQRTPSKTSSNASTSFGSSFLSGKPMLINPVLSKARALAPNGRIDTTRTPYFRLKALGLTPSEISKPETPSSRRGTKRSRDDENEGLGTSKSAKVTPPQKGSNLNGLDSWRDSRRREGHGNVEPDTPSTEGGKVYDEDEELFAQMRQVKEAMAESIQLYQEERAKREVSRRVSGRTAEGSSGKVKPSERLQGVGPRQGRPREVLLNRSVVGAKAAFEEQDEEVMDEEIEEVGGEADEAELEEDGNGAEEGEDEGEDEDENEDENEDEDEADEEIEEGEEDEDFSEGDEDFDEVFEESNEDDESDSAESEDLTGLTATGAPSSLGFTSGGFSSNAQRQMHQPAPATGKGNSIEDAIEL
ncbi:MAG: hypothetical protein M1835_006508 [Candelina submexicana]|nr:MAG: hypothetical protein M1835_006508 [Candelina submexicana]